MTKLSPPWKNRRDLVIAAVLFICLGVPLGHAATSIRQHGITWTFDRDYPTGRFANGDYWVVGPVTIVSITPSSNGKAMHGSMINPRINGSQGYDNRIKNNPYAASLNVSTQLPVVLSPGTSLLSSESYAKHATGDHSQLKTIAVLTVLGEPAPEGSFRPPYVGKDKTLHWNKSQLRYDRLRSLPRVAHAPKPSTVAARFERPWIEQKTNWTGRYMHPRENQPGYGREIAHAIAQAALTLQLDYSQSQKETLLIRLVQYGIDIYGAARNGAAWPAGGGHNHGRKLPLLLAGAVLDDQKMLEYADGQKLLFQEDRQTFYVTQADVGRALYTVDKRPRIPYVQADVGIAEWGEKHYFEPKWDGRNWNAYYRQVAGSSTIGHVLAARLMGLQEAWNWPAAFDYYDRYWSIEKSKASNGPNTIQRFVAEMWKAYREATPAEFSDRTVATDVWQNTTITSQSGSFTISFDLLASAPNINSVTGLSRGPASGYGDLATAVRFAPSGYIDARDGKSFRAATRLVYQPGIKYRVVMTVDVKAKRYSVSVTPPGADPVVIADGWRFRAEQSGTDALSNLGFRSADGYHAVLNLGLEAANAVAGLDVGALDALRL